MKLGVFTPVFGGLDVREMLARVRAQDAAAKFERTVALVDWRPYFESDAARISFAGQAVGRKLGHALFAEAPGLRTLHVVGTSAGAWPANEVCTAYVEAAAAAATKSRAAVILSLTDPFTQRATHGVPPLDLCRRVGAESAAQQEKARESDEETD